MTEREGDSEGAVGIDPAIAASTIGAASVDDYRAAGVDDRSTAIAWFSVGISPGGARQLSEVGVSPFEGLRRFRAGWPPAEAAQQVRDGIPFVDRLECDPMRFGDAFRRRGNVYAVRKEALARVDAAANGLCVPGRTKSSMFSDMETGRFLLDGAWRSHSGYGFGSWSGDWIVGAQALRFICSRCGNVAPKRLKDEDSIPTTDELERRFFALIANDWEELGQRPL